MSDNELPELSPEAQRLAGLSLTVGKIIRNAYDEIAEKLDGLTERGYTEDEIVAALGQQGETDILDWYGEWAGIDTREDDNTTLNPVVPDPGDAPSYERNLGKEPEPEADVCPFDCDSCHDEDCPCDRLGCAGSEAPGAR